MKVVQQEHKKESEYKVSNVILHPKYDSPKKPPAQYDIAILKLAAPVHFSNFFVCLPRNNKDQLVGQNVTAIGWGRTKFDSTSVSKVLRAASFSVMENYECREIFEKRLNEIAKKKDPNATHIDYNLHPYILCADPRNTNYSTCNGDSGGKFYKNIIKI